MKRALVLLAIPVALFAVVVMQRSTDPEAGAEVELTTDEVVALRGAVIARMTAFGGVRVGEQTDYAGGGQATLTFRVPATRLEEALVELNQVGGTVVSQKVDIDEITAPSQRLARDVSDLESCIDGLSQPLSDGDLARALTDVQSCARRADTIAGAVTGDAATPVDATILVRISPRASTNALVVIAVIVMAVALAVMAFLTIRSLRESNTIDLSDDDEPAGDYIFDRHWN